MMLEALRCSYREDGKFCLALHQAQLMRLEGRKFYAQGKYLDAERRFTDAAINLDRASSKKNVALALTNRSIVCAKLGWWPESYADAMSAIKFDPSSAKAAFRCGIALENMHLLRPASAAYYRAIELDQTLYAEATPAIERCRMENIQAKKNASLLLTQHEEPYHKPILKPPILKTPLNTKPYIWFGLGPGRCGLHSLATLVHTSSRQAVAFALNNQTYRQLIWNPSEPRERVIQRRIAFLRNQYVHATSVGDIHFSWLPYLEQLAQLEPDAKFVVLRRDPQKIADSWFYWTEAGSRRQSTHQGDIQVFSHPKDHWRTWWKHHNNAPYDFDEWDLSFPTTSDPTISKRQAILQYVHEYYDTCYALAKTIGQHRFHFCDCEYLFDIDYEHRHLSSRTALFTFLGLPHDDAINAHHIHQNKQRYIYDLQGLDDESEDFQIGDFRRLDPNRKQAQPHHRAIKGKEQDVPKTSTITVPPDAKPGDTLRFRLAGQTRTAIVPANAKPGDRFTIPRDLNDDSSPTILLVDSSQENLEDENILDEEQFSPEYVIEMKRRLALIPEQYFPGKDPFGYDDSLHEISYDDLQAYFGDITFDDLVPTPFSTLQ